MALSTQTAEVVEEVVVEEDVTRDEEEEVRPGVRRTLDCIWRWRRQHKRAQARYRERRRARDRRCYALGLMSVSRLQSWYYGCADW